MEGAIAPATVVALAARYGDSIAEEDIATRYSTPDFKAFIEAYKWVTSYLRAPADYALVAAQLARYLLSQNVVYAEVTLSVGVMLLRKQDVAANFRAIREATAPFEQPSRERQGLRLQWIFDTVRQFGPAAAWDVARVAAEIKRDTSLGQMLVAYGIGGDELSVPATEFREVFNYAAENGLHRVAHAGEIGGPESVAQAVGLLGAERIGHGIAAIRDPQVIALLAERSIPLEICPTSNVRTGALARQLGATHATVGQHPLPALLRTGVPIAVSSDDPAMFDTDLNREYAVLAQIGLSTPEIVSIAEAGFTAAFLPSDEKAVLLKYFREKAAALGLL